MDGSFTGYDFSRIRSAVIYRKNLLPMMVSLITFSSFMIIFLIFGGLYLAKVPVEINDVLRQFAYADSIEPPDRWRLSHRTDGIEPLDRWREPVVN